MIAFGGRALDKDAQAKYLNSPETPLFHKGDTLYNIAAARQAAHDGATPVVVEGYVDVIAMVNAGFPAAVAPLGTALTENQLMLLWRMADEPILCFDGDRAGQKAAGRAADLALPHLKPGKSLRFALLPEGQDPDDLARSGGRGAIEEVIASARPLAEVIWLREIEGGAYATPERRAALEARINEMSQSIARRGGAQILSAGSAGAAAAAVSAGGERRPRLSSGRARGFQGGYGGRPRPRIRAAIFSPAAANFTGRGGGRGGFAQAGAAAFARGPYQAASPQLATSSLIRGQRSAISRREALILKTLLNHPWLLHEHLEEVAALELAHPEAHRLRASIIAAWAADHHHSGDPEEQSEKLRADLAKGGFSELLQRVERSITNRRRLGRASRRRGR